MYVIYAPVMEIQHTISSTEARKRFAEIIDQVADTGARYTLTVNGRPKVVIIGAEELDSIEETLDIMSSPEEMEAIRRGQEDIAAGRVFSMEQILEDLHARK